MRAFTNPLRRPNRCAGTSRFTTMRLTIVAMVLFVAAGCHRKPQPVVVPPLPKVEIADIPAPASSSVVVENGSTLHAIAEVAYGHRDFSGFVGQLNRVASPERLLAGAKLKTPSLPIAFRDAGLDPRYQPAINALAKAWYDLQSTLPAYLKARDANGTGDGRSFQIPQDLRLRLSACADAVDAAIDVLNHPANGHNVPRKTIGQFAGISRSLRGLSMGSIGSRDYDTFLLQKAFGFGFTYALIWTQEYHQ